MKFQEIVTVDFPAWALCAVINGDVSALNDDDIDTLDSWEKDMVQRYGAITYNSIDDESYFCGFPEFGLPCDCERVELWGTF